MNNYFTSVPLFARLYERGYGACETAQPNSEDFPPKLVKLRKDHSESLPWGTVNAVVVDNVLCLAWQDNNAVLALSTIHSLKDLIIWNQQRPGKISTNAKIVLKVFDDSSRKKLEFYFSS